MSRNSLGNLHKLIAVTRADTQVNEKSALPLEVMFLNSLEQTITLENTKPNKSSTYYKPSSMNCLRNMYYGVKGALKGDILEPMKTNVIGICESGTDRHKRIQSYITKMNEKGFSWEYLDVAKYIEENKLTHLEVKENYHKDEEDNFETLLVDKELNMILSMDGLLKYNGTEIIGFEYKTESDSTWVNRTDINEDHKNQAFAYASRLGIDRIIFVYENRNNCFKKSYMLNITKENKDYIINRVNDCEKYVKNNTLPPKTDNKKTCYFCKYKDICDKDINVGE
jgi:CRISPR/Cas system-associated exonuclease Cas4 (RecB family)